MAGLRPAGGLVMLLVLAVVGCAGPTASDASVDDTATRAPAVGTRTATRAPDETSPGPGRSYEVTAEPGAEAGSARTPVRPDAVRLASGTSVPVRVASTDRRGLLRVPRDIRAAGWWDGGARLDDAYGSLVIAGHVDSSTQGLGPFAELLSARRGDRIAVAGGDTSQDFVVESVDLVPKVSLDTRDDTFAATGPLRLVLITCSGPFLPAQGGYQDLAVVTARPDDGRHGGPS